MSHKLEHSIKLFHKTLPGSIAVDLESDLAKFKAEGWSEIPPKPDPEPPPPVVKSR